MRTGAYLDLQKTSETPILYALLKLERQEVCRLCTLLCRHPAHRQGSEGEGKMQSIGRSSFAIGLCALLWSVAYAAGQSVCDSDERQASGSIYRICMPPANDYNGSLVIWAHGFQDAGTPVQIPEDQ